MRASLADSGPAVSDRAPRGQGAGALRWVVWAAWLCCLVGGRPAQAQEKPSPLRVAQVRFEGNRFFPESTLASLVRTRPNRRFLGIPGLTWWLWVYRLGEGGGLGRRLSQVLQASGEAPAYLDPLVLAADAERLQVFYRQEGFRQAQVAARVDTLGPAAARVTFAVDPGPPSWLRRVAYAGLDSLTALQRQRLVRGAVLNPAPGSAPLAFTAQQQRFAEPQLEAERRRLLTFLREAGYASASRDSIRAFVQPAGPDSFDVTFRVNPGPRYRFGYLRFVVTGPEAGVAPRADTLLGGAATLTLQGESVLEGRLLRRALQFRPGDWYAQDELLATKRRLDATGVFAFTDVAALPPDTTCGPAPCLPHRFELRTRARHRVRLETFVLQRSSVLAGSDSELGTGLGLAYENANLFGGGEAFRLSVSGSVAASSDDLELFTSAQAEGAASLTLPYLTAPLGGLSRSLGLYDARTRFSLSLLTARRDELRLVIRGRGAARARFELQHRPTVTSLLDLVDLSVSNPDTLSGFRARFLDRLLVPGDSLLDPVQRAQLLEDYTRPQINNALRYTLRSARVNPLLRAQGYSYEAALELGGNLPFLLDRLVFSPDTLEGSLPGLPFFRGGRTQNRLVYRQYARATLDLRRYRTLSRRVVVAGKAFAGLAQPLGRSAVVPFDRRFYSGGATSVRGWGLRELGPGAARFPDSTATDETNLLGGDVKLEAGLELRTTLLRQVIGADWMLALFADAGNVWFGPRNPGSEVQPEGRFRLAALPEQVGVGAGAGLRLGWEFLVLRLDLAYRVHDPLPGAGDVLSGDPPRPTLHFGIGHTF